MCIRTRTCFYYCEQIHSMYLSRALSSKSHTVQIDKDGTLNPKTFPIFYLRKWMFWRVRGFGYRGHTSYCVSHHLERNGLCIYYSIPKIVKGKNDFKYHEHALKHFDQVQYD